jgi:hypothetical protein
MTFMGMAPFDFSGTFMGKAPQPSFPQSNCQDMIGRVQRTRGKAHLSATQSAAPVRSAGSGFYGYQKLKSLSRENRIVAIRHVDRDALHAAAQCIVTPFKNCFPIRS